MNNKLKKVCVIMCCLLSIHLSEQQAKADVIIEPRDEFYSEHHEETEYTGRRTYIANGEEGYVTLYESPLSKNVLKYLTNGEEAVIGFVYYDKSNCEWGCIEDFSGNVTQSGWVHMSEMSVIYDNYSFIEEYREEFTDYQGELDGYVMKDHIYFYTYPNSGEVSATLYELNEDISVSETYLDENNRLWGKVDYYYGNRGWICISEPENDKLPAMEVRDIEIITPKQGPDEKEQTNKSLWIAGIMVFGVIVITIILIRRFYHKK